MKRIYDLRCRYDSRNSFYGKAKVEEIFYKETNSTQYNLYSYNTLVAIINKYQNRIVYHYLGKYSQTTTRHQKEFFKQFDLSEEEIKKLFVDKTIIKEF